MSALTGAKAFDMQLYSMCGERTEWNVDMLVGYGNFTYFCLLSYIIINYAYIIGFLVVCIDYVMNLNIFTRMNNTDSLMIFASNSPMTIWAFSVKDIICNKSRTYVAIHSFEHSLE